MTNGCCMPSSPLESGSEQCQLQYGGNFNLLCLECLLQCNYYGPKVTGVRPDIRVSNPRRSKQLHLQ